jgi:DNA topoisomerase I
VRIGRYGPYLTDGVRRSAIPDTLAPDEVTIAEAERILSTSLQDAPALGTHPESGEAVYLKNGPYGHYFQLGEMAEGVKPRMVSLLPNYKPEEASLELALRHLTLPRKLGSDPQSSDEIIVATGRFGPYIKCGSETRSLPAGGVSPLDITLEQAHELLQQPKTRGRGRVASTTLKELGAHPTSGAALFVKSGRYGP